MRYFANKVVWITGASSGLGRALAREFAKSDARIIISARRIERLENLSKEIQVKTGDENANVLVLPLDVTDCDQVKSAVDDVKARFGKIDVLVNNAGISQRSLLKDTEFPVIKRIMETNFLGPVNLTMQALPLMNKDEGAHIVVISSIMGKFGTRLRSGYCASKHALQGFFESVGDELRDENISVTLILPGFLKTEITMKALTGDGSRHGIVDHGQAKADSPEHYSAAILKAVAKKKFEHYIALDFKTRGGLFLKKNFPKVLRLAVRILKVT